MNREIDEMTITLPRWMGNLVDTQCHGDPELFNSFVVSAAAAKVANMNRRAFFTERLGSGDAAPLRASFDRAGEQSPREGDEILD